MMHGRDVAVKTMNVDPGTTPDQTARDAERFRCEAQAAARLDHAGLATVYDLGEEGGTRYLVMQYVNGVDLGDHIAENGPLPVAETAAIGVQIASVHAKNVVHRDLKARNVRIRTDGVVKVLDFGVAALLDPDAAKLTTTGERPGTLECMASEQVAAKPLDHRTDLYALGCLLYEMLTGRAVFTHESDLMVPGMILDEPPTPPGMLRDGIPSGLEELVLQLLSRNLTSARHTPARSTADSRWLPGRLDPELALMPWAEVDPLRPFQHPMGPDARPVRDWARQAGRNR